MGMGRKMLQYNPAHDYANGLELGTQEREMYQIEAKGKLNIMSCLIKNWKGFQESKIFGDWGMGPCGYFL